MDEKVKTGPDMKIIVCVKVVPDTSVLDFDLDTNSFDPQDFVYMINPLDMMALEEAINIKEKTGAEVICMSVAPQAMKKQLRRCLAMGADSAVMLWDKKFENSDCFATASILARAIRKIGFDLILCGSRALDDEDGIVGPATAALLDIPHISEVTRIENLKGDQKAKVHRALERGEREILECSLPALFTVHQTLNIPRYPDFPSSLAALEKEILVSGLDELGLTEDQVGERGSLTEVAGMSLPRPRPRVTIRIDSSLSPPERMKLLATGGVSDRQTELLEGEPKDIAQKIISIIESAKNKKETRKNL